MRKLWSKRLGDYLMKGGAVTSLTMLLILIIGSYGFYGKCADLNTSRCTVSIIGFYARLDRIVVVLATIGIFVILLGLAMVLTAERPVNYRRS